MSFGRKWLSHLSMGIIIVLSLVTVTFATTEFYLFTDDVEQGMGCDYLEINNNQVTCTDKSLLITYDLSRIKKLEVVYEGKKYHIDRFTQDAKNKINSINSKKIGSKTEKDQEKIEKGKYSSWKAGIAEKLSFDNFQSVVQSLKNQFRLQADNNTLSVILIGFGLVVFFIGSFGYLIATFRVGVLWGLSCMFLPLVSFIFLFVHWKVAAKPFFVSILGMAIAFSGTLLESVDGASSPLLKRGSISLAKKEKNGGKYVCSGKIYCSEMTSCAEAKFYLRNCPGTKMDGDNDGIPCEKQWCSH
jgi:hypothetical protein